MLLIAFFHFLASFVSPGNNINTDSLVAVARKNVSTYIDLNNSLSAYYSIDNTGVSIYESANSKLNNKVECKIFWSELPTFKYLLATVSYDSLLNIFKNKGDKKFDFSAAKNKNENLVPDTLQLLKGKKIAIDPGHISGDMELGKIEYKYLRLKKDSLKGIQTPIELIEGNLTLATAHFLKEKLESQGATVLLTREKSGQSAFGISYDEWLKSANNKTFEDAYANKEITLEEKNRFIKKRNRRDIFQTYFKFADMRERALKINNFHPDLALVVHYNVNEKNIPWTGVTPKNYCMTFVPGNIKNEYFEKPENRLELLRLIITNDIESSIALSSNVTASFEKVLQVPLATKKDAEYLEKESLETKGDGVFIRNLALTRLIHGTMVYGESLYQDNEKECKLLSELTTSINGINTSVRVKQVADAYYDAILRYYLPMPSNK